jgi:hypothetical protein
MPIAEKIKFGRLIALPFEPEGIRQKDVQDLLQIILKPKPFHNHLLQRLVKKEIFKSFQSLGSL